MIGVYDFSKEEYPNHAIRYYMEETGEETTVPYGDIRTLKEEDTYVYATKNYDTNTLYCIKSDYMNEEQTIYEMKKDGSFREIGKLAADGIARISKDYLYFTTNDSDYRQTLHCMPFHE